MPLPNITTIVRPPHNQNIATAYIPAVGKALLRYVTNGLNRYISKPNITIDVTNWNIGMKSIVSPLSILESLYLPPSVFIIYRLIFMVFVFYTVI
jgi:hypothetical protein